MAVPNGVYEVTVHAGDMVYHSRADGGDDRGNPVCAAGHTREVIATTFTGIVVGDGELTLFFEDLGDGLR